MLQDGSLAHPPALFGTQLPKGSREVQGCDEAMSTVLCCEISAQSSLTRPPAVCMGGQQGWCFTVHRGHLSVLSMGTWLFSAPEAHQESPGSGECKPSAVSTCTAWSSFNLPDPGLQAVLGAVQLSFCTHLPFHTSSPFHIHEPTGAGREQKGELPAPGD